MFGTLRLNPSDAGPIFVERADGAAFSALGNNVPQHTACDQCRQKKLRCTGRKSGCDRCKANSIDCTYTQIFPGNGRRRERKRPASQHCHSRSRSASAPSPSPEQTDEVDAGTHESIVVASSRKSKSPPVTRPSNSTPPPVTTAGDNNATGSSKTTSDPTGLGQEISTSFLEEQHHYDGHNGGSHTWDAEFNLFDMDAAMGTRTGFDQITGNSNPTLAAFHWSPYADPALAGVSSPRAGLNAHQMDTFLDGPISASSHTSTATTCVLANHAGGGNGVVANGNCCTGHCLQLMKSLLEEVDGCVHDMGPCQVDAALSYQKRACMQCSQIMLCKSCYVDPDCMMFLTMICDKLIMLNKKILWYTMEGTTVQRPLYAGEYEMDQLDEWGGMVQHLSGVQLRKIKTLVEDIEASPGIEGKHAQRIMLKSVKNQVAALLGRIREALSKDVEIGEP
ncbi:hypothetical protein QBC37DRAFT_428089 [Rhypophila decipiens]|uniref:Zn(2)-C6 fungal-type domain-containing protein n=1 Tax=Rhypophila decipiens TaxID=261697 RepID=A0AAN6Y1F1_9PEZI|nr:hypothetical protein QBC37DRAFT_428089 [Rhypophila decipiens]